MEKKENELVLSKQKDLCYEYKVFNIATEIGLSTYTAKSWMVDLIMSHFEDKENSTITLISEKAGKIMYNRDRIIKIQEFPEKQTEKEIADLMRLGRVIKISDIILK